MAGLIALLLHGLVMPAMALLLAGGTPWLQARLAGRAGPAMLQPWHDWRRLLRKRPLVREGAALSPGLGPTAALITAAVAGLLVPSFTLGMATAPLGDLVVVAGLLGLGRAIGALAAIDAGTAPSGLAAIRAVRLGTLAEPALVLVLFTVALLAGTTNLDAVVATLREAPGPGVPLLLVMAGLAALVVAIEAEADGAPADASGWHAAAAEAATALRRVVWLSLLAVLLVPNGVALPGAGVLGWLAGLVAWAAKLAVLGVACAIAGPLLQRAGRAAIGPLMGAAVLLGLLALLFLFAGQGLT